MVKWHYWQAQTLFLHVYLQPRASKNEIIGLHADCLKIRLTAPPIEGRANEALCQYLAACFQVPLKQVTIAKGASSRKKWVRIDGPVDLGMLKVTF